MPKMKFHGGKLNGKRLSVDRLDHEFIFEYAKPNKFNCYAADFNFSPVFTKIREVYLLTHVKYINKFGEVEIRSGYMKKGSKTKPETVWKYGITL
jgi:hypothetical protein